MNEKSACCIGTKWLVNSSEGMLKTVLLDRQVTCGTDVTLIGESALLVNCSELTAILEQDGGVDKTYWANKRYHWRCVYLRRLSMSSGYLTRRWISQTSKSRSSWRPQSGFAAASWTTDKTYELSTRDKHSHSCESGTNLSDKDHGEMSSIYLCQGYFCNQCQL